MPARIFCLVTGYLFGNILTAEIVTRRLTGSPCSQLGHTGNPGMANVMKNLGFKSGITVLAGDLAKCAAAMLLCYLAVGTSHGFLTQILRAGMAIEAGTPAGTAVSTFSSTAGPAVTYSGLGRLSLLYAGTGCTLGHNFPFWQRFRGGKGVATTCAAIFIVSPLWGLLSMIAGMLTVFATQYLCVGGVVIPAVFTVFCFSFFGPEYGWVSLFLTVLMFQRHWPALRTVPSGTCEKTDVPGAIRSKLRHTPDTRT